MSKPVPPAEARVAHLVESAERAKAHDLLGASSRFAGYALDILNEKRVRNAGTYRQRLLALEEA